ncbi:hypothetical protein HXX76_008779 [Chlamydomonas incerta]|uniref:Methyl-accepting transducer domain-containing protein n=1 Tax=Chlamydomonas incerta TaxID=51695 RepID=A0A835SX15_CHLIN|nr:hypothetical protein HXX76_008779 [Chlamydomonas incerta]|eukprot:KAG2433052.1 hypothetical protein HXX76_008779 [Chlamydomonas incerta]
MACRARRLSSFSLVGSARLRTLAALLLVTALVLLLAPSQGAHSRGSSQAPPQHRQQAQASPPAAGDDDDAGSGGFGSDLGAVAAELLNPRSWDVIAPEVVLPAERGGHRRGAASTHAATVAGSAPDPCSHQGAEAHEAHGRTVISRAVGLLRGAAGALAARLREAAWRTGGAVLHGVEHTASDMAHDLREPSAWEENPWVAQEVQRLLQQEMGHGRSSPQQAGMGQQSGQQAADAAAAAAGPCPGAGAARGASSLAAAMGVEGHVRALVKELHTLVATLEDLSRPAADLSSAQQLQPLADGAAAARRHTEDLRLALQAAAAAGPLAAESPGSGEADTPLPSAAAAIGPWLVEITEHAEQELGQAEELVRAALGYGEHGATATAHTIVSAAADWVHSALVLLRDTATAAAGGTAATPRPVTGTAPAAAAAGAAPLASALLGEGGGGRQCKDAAGGRTGAGHMEETCSFADMTVPVTGIPPTPHLPASLEELPADAGAARAVLIALPPATLAVVGQELLVGACGEAQRLKNLAAYPQQQQQQGAGAGAADTGEPSVIGARLFLAFVEAESDAHEALEHLAAHDGAGARAGTGTGSSPSAGLTTTAIDALLRCRGRLGDLRRAIAEFSPAAGDAYQPPNDAGGAPSQQHEQEPQAGIAEEPGDEGAGRSRQLIGMAVIQAAWSRAAHAAGALGSALHLQGSRDTAGGGGGQEEAQHQRERQRQSSAWPFGGAAAAFVPAAAVALNADERPDVGNESAGNLQKLPAYHVPHPPQFRLTAPLRAAIRRTADASAAAHHRVAALIQRAVAAASQALANAKAATLPRPPRHPHPSLAASKAAEAAAAAAHAARDAAGGGSHKVWGGIRSIGALLWAPVQAMRERVGGWHGTTPEAAPADAGGATAEALDAKLMGVWRSAVEQLEASAASFDSVQRMLLAMPRLGAVGGLGPGDTIAASTADAAGAGAPGPGQPPATLTVEPLLKACRRRTVPGGEGSGEGQQHDDGTVMCKDEDAAANATAAGAGGAAAHVREAAVSPGMAALHAVEAAGAALQDFLSRTGARLGAAARGQAANVQSVAQEAAGAAAAAAHQVGAAAAHAGHATCDAVAATAAAAGNTATARVAQHAASAAQHGAQRAAHAGAEAAQHAADGVNCALHRGSDAVHDAVMHGATSLGSAAVGAADMIRSARHAAGCAARDTAAGAASAAGDAAHRLGAGVVGSRGLAEDSVRRTARAARAAAQAMRAAVEAAGRRVESASARARDAAAGTGRSAADTLHSAAGLAQHKAAAAGEAVGHGAALAAEAVREAGQAAADAAAGAAGAMQSCMRHAGSEVVDAVEAVGHRAQHGAEHAAEAVAGAAADAARGAAGAAAKAGRRTAWLGAKLWLQAQFAWVTAPSKAARAVWRVYMLPVWLWRRLHNLPPPLALAPPLERAAEAVAGKIAETERRGAQSAGEVLQRLSAAAHVLPPRGGDGGLRRGHGVDSARAAAEHAAAAATDAASTAGQRVLGAGSGAAGATAAAAAGALDHAKATAGGLVDAAAQALSPRGGDHPMAPRHAHPPLPHGIQTVGAAAACTAENTWDAACCVAGAAADSAACWGAAGNILAHDVVSSVAKGAHTVGETMAAVPSAAAAAASRATEAAREMASEAAAAAMGGVDRFATATRDAAAAARLAAECAAAGVGSAACKAVEAIRLAAECAAAGVGSAACKAAEAAAAVARGAVHGVEGAAHAVGGAVTAAGEKAWHTAAAAAGATAAAADAAHQAASMAAHRAADQAAAVAGAVRGAGERVVETATGGVAAAAHMAASAGGAVTSAAARAARAIEDGMRDAAAGMGSRAAAAASGAKHAAANAAHAVAAGANAAGSAMADATERVTEATYAAAGEGMETVVDAATTAGATAGAAARAAREAAAMAAAGAASGATAAAQAMEGAAAQTGATLGAAVRAGHTAAVHSAEAAESAAAAAAGSIQGAASAAGRGAARAGHAASAIGEEAAHRLTGAEQATLGAAERAAATFASTAAAAARGAAAVARVTVQGGRQLASHLHPPRPPATAAPGKQPQPPAAKPPDARLPCSGDDCFGLADALIDSLLAPLGSAAGPAAVAAHRAGDGGYAAAGATGAGSTPRGGAAIIMTLPRDELLAVAADLYGPADAGLSRADVAVGLMAAAAAGGGAGDDAEGGGNGGVMGRMREAVAERLHDAAVRLKP